MEGNRAFRRGPDFWVPGRVSNLPPSPTVSMVTEKLVILSECISSSVNISYVLERSKWLNYIKSVWPIVRTQINGNNTISVTLGRLGSNTGLQVLRQEYLLLICQARGTKFSFILMWFFCRISREKHQFATKFLHFSGFVEAQQNLVPKPLNSSIIPDWLETKPSQKTFIGPSVSQVFPSIRIGVYSSF